MTQHDTPPADRADLRDRIAAAIHDNRFPDSSWAAQPEVIRADYRSVADAVLAVLPAPAEEIKQLREKHKASLRRADEINNALMEEVQRYADGKERPVLWSVYNEMHLRAIEAETELEKLRRLSPPVDRAALLEIADAIAGIDFHPKARARSLDIAAGLATRLRRMADEAQQDLTRHRECGAREPEPRTGTSPCVLPAGHGGTRHQDKWTNQWPIDLVAQPAQADTAPPAPVMEPWRGATELASDREILARATAGLVGYRQGRGTLLHCLAHKPAPASRWVDFHEVTADDLHDGGICVHPRCGRDLLAPWPANEAQQDGVQP